MKKLLDFENQEKGYEPFSINANSVKQNVGRVICYVDFVEPYRGTYFVRYGRLHSVSRNTLFLDDKERRVDINKILQAGIKIESSEILPK